MAGTSYTRQSTITDGNLITASLFNNEYNQLLNAFAYSSTGTTGHTHDGTAGQGGAIGKIGDQDFKNKIEISATDNRIECYIEVGGSPVEQLRIQDGAIVPVTDSDIDLGTTSLRFKDAFVDSLTVTGVVTATGFTIGSAVITEAELEILDGKTFLDEDDLVSDSATGIPSQQSVKAYVDAQVTAQDLDLTDGTTSISIDLDSEALSVLGGTGVTSTASGNGVTLAIDSTVATLTGSQTLTNKTLTAPDVNTPDIDGGTIDGTIIGGTTAAAGSFTTVDATGNITVGGTVDGRDVAADGTKLDGIESSADVTDTTNVTAAGALMDSEVTNLAQVKAFDSSDYATAAQGTTADAALPKAGGAMTGAITTNSTFDGRDVATDGTKLDGIEAGADVTDTTNVTAAGALMDSELTSIASVKALNQGVATTDSPQFVGITSTSNVIVGGNLTVNGTTTTLNTATLDVEDKNITINYGAGDTTGSANGAGITIQDAVDVSTDATILWDTTNDEFDFSHPINVAGTSTFAGLTTSADVSFGDNDKAIFGAGDDLQIYHDGSNSYINDAGTGNLYLRASNAIIMQSADGAETIASFHDDNLCRLYFDNAIKLATSSTGIDVTGNVTMATGGSIVAGGVNDLILNAGESGTPDIYLQSGGSTKVKIEGSNGNVGIGNDSPTQLLTIGDTSDSASRIQFFSSATGANTIHFGDGASADAYVGYINYDHSSNSLQFAAGGTEAMRIDSSGNALVRRTSSLSSQSGSVSANTVVSAHGPLSSHATNAGILEYYNDETLLRSYGANAGSGKLVFKVGGGAGSTDSEAMRIDSSGTLLIGTSDGSGAGLEISKVHGVRPSVINNVAAIFDRMSSDGPVALFRRDGTTVGSIGAQGGDLYLGTDDANIKFYNSASIQPVNSVGGVRDNAIDLGASSARFKDLYLSGNIVASGEHSLLNDNNEANFFNNLTSSSQIYFGYDDIPTGANIQSYGFYGGTGTTTFVPLLASAFTVSSDYRLKENVVSLSNGIDRLKQLSPKQFTWVENNPMGVEPNQVVDGFLAHEVQDVIPEAVHGEKDAEISDKGEGYQRIDQAKIVPLLTAALQEAITKIENLQSRVTELENN